MGPPPRYFLKDEVVVVTPVGGTVPKVIEIQQKDRGVLVARMRCENFQPAGGHLKKIEVLDEVINILALHGRMNRQGRQKPLLILLDAHGDCRHSVEKLFIICGVATFS